MSSKFVFLLNACLAAASPSLIPRQGDDDITYEQSCDEDKNPNWDDCQGAMDMVSDYAGNDANYFWKPPAAPNDAYYWDNGNCRAAIGFQGSNGFQHNYVVNAFRSIEPCSSFGASGHAKLKNHGWSMSVELISVPSKLSGGDDSDEKRDLVTRQDEEGWVTGFTIKNSSPEQYWQQVQASLPGGSGSNSWTIEESDTKTYGVETSVEVGADLFKVFSASASVSFSYEDQVTSTTGQTILCDCTSSQTGTLYWAPKYTQYHGSYKNGGPSGVDIYIPNGDGEGRYELRCSEN